MRDKDDIPYPKTVLAVGDGKIEPVILADGTAAIPLHPDLLKANHNIYNDRGILAPTNNNIDQINDFILRKMPGNVHEHLSSDKIIKDDENMPDVVSVAYLSSINVPGTPPHKLNLKVGALIVFIRNINFDCGLVNGKRGVVRGIS
ncbi:unnamed protein product [Ectocarpus sp. 8 AP-2014]